MAEEFDWRLQAVTDVVAVGESSARFPKGSKATIVSVNRLQMPDGRTLVFPIPNATALLLNSSQRAYKSAQNLLAKAQQRPPGHALFLDYTEAIDVIEHLSLAVFSSYTSVECFANEWISEWLNYQKSSRSGALKTINSEDMERHLSLREKLDQVLPPVFDVKSPKGRQVWEEFSKLEEARNRVVHMKRADRESAEGNADTVWQKLIALPAPHLTAKKIVDWYMSNRSQVAGLIYDQYKPVMPRWFAECPLEI